MKNLLKRENLKFRWVNTTFPFTRPSLEMEIHSSSIFGDSFQGDEWLEVLGCGIVHQDILTKMGSPVNKGMGWAFGIGLERIAMLYFGIPDIRAMWSQNDAFLAQFEETGMATKYRILSPHPMLYRDISFWVYHSHDSSNSSSILRLNDGNIKDSFKSCLDRALPDCNSTIARVQLIDQFENKKKGATSFCFRVTYQCHEGPMTQAQVDPLHESLANVLKETYENIELRI